MSQEEREKEKTNTSSSSSSLAIFPLPQDSIVVQYQHLSSIAPSKESSTSSISPKNSST